MESYSSTKVQSWLIWFLKGVLIFTFLLLTARLLELQVIKGSYFRELSEGNRVRRVPIIAPRGDIVARGGETIAGSVEVDKKLVFDEKEGFKKLSKFEDTDVEELITEWKREYKLGKLAGHVTGYLGEVDEDEVGEVNENCTEKGIRNFGQKVGRSGLEQEYECALSGVNGEELVEVDSSGVKVRTLGIKEPKKGDGLKTTIDFDLQRNVAEVMNEIKGAVIVTDGSGEVLALYSSPSYDPNTFINGDAEKIMELINDPDKSLYNRVIGGKFHPGSVYKPLVSLAALEEDVIDEDYTYVDEGVVTVDTIYGDFSYSNWYFNQYGETEGEIDLTRAIARSTDTFFYELGDKLGVDNIVKWSHNFELDKKTGIDLPGEVVSLIPDRVWKEKVKKEQWFLGNTYHMSIGQGDLALTPIALHRMILGVATGKICKPTLTFDSDCRNLEVDKDNLQLVIEGMEEACSEGGTGYTFFELNSAHDNDEETIDRQNETASEVGSKIKVNNVACKTGTAETSEETDPHAWFTFFTPLDDPEIVVTVMVENGGEGSSVAGPLAREIYDSFYSRL